MKKPKITKGEWFVTESQLAEVKIIHGTMEDGVISPEGDVVSEVAPTPEEMQNAIAISAVPEMLDALIKARKDLGIWLMYADEFGGRTLDTRDAIDSIEKALRKAGVEMEGVTP